MDVHSLFSVVEEVSGLCFDQENIFVDIFTCSGKSPPCFPIFLSESSVVAMPYMFFDLQSLVEILGSQITFGDFFVLCWISNDHQSSHFFSKKMT